MNTFKALAVDKRGDDVALSPVEWNLSQLLPGDVTIRVKYSSINYKDSLAVRADGKVARRYPLVPGVDLAGEVTESSDPRFRPGAQVLAHGYDLGVAHHGGFAGMARIPGEWVVALPDGLTPRQAMCIGTAGFTAALSVQRMEHMGLRPGDGRVLVTGSSGGVGSIAVDILAARGYEVAASTGSEDAHDYLRDLGATEVLGRAETSAPSERPLERPRWVGAVDAVGGATLAYLVRTLHYGGSVAVSGNTGGAAVSTTVLPFILRGVNILGVDSAQLPMAQRIGIWERLATDLRPPHLEQTIAREISLEEVPTMLDRIHLGGVRGRVIVGIEE